MPENQEVEEDAEELDEADVEREFISFQKIIKLKFHNIKIFVIDSEEERSLFSVFPSSKIHGSVYNINYSKLVLNSQYNPC